LWWLIELLWDKLAGNQRVRRVASAAMSLNDDFQAAIKRVNALPQSPGTDVQLQLYGLYKQATTGDASGKRPGMMDVRGRAKFDAWAKNKGMSKDDAMTAYMKRADELGA
jgi:acyl-CoA-binding protein